MIIFILFCFVVILFVLKVYNMKYWLYLVLVVLVSVCFCGFIFLILVVIFCVFMKVVILGFLIKGVDYFEILVKIKIVVFDKIGIIIRGEFIVVDFKLLYRDISLCILFYW